VRALVQVGGITLVTSMATASTVEQAEDQARLRVLAMLGIDTKNGSNLPSMSLVPIPTLPSSAHFPPLPLSDSQPQPTDHPTLGAPETAATVAPEPMPRLSLIQSPLIHPPLIHPPSWGSALEDKPSPIEPSPIEPGIVLNRSIPGSLPSQPEITQTIADVLVTDDLSPAEHESAMPAPMADTKTSTKPRKPAALKNPVATEPVAPPTDNLDLTDLIIQIGHEMERVGWTQEEGRNYLNRTYGKRSRQQLTDDELIDFLIYLKALPSPTEIS